MADVIVYETSAYIGAPFTRLANGPSMQLETAKMQGNSYADVELDDGVKYLFNFTMMRFCEYEQAGPYSKQLEFRRVVLKAWACRHCTVQNDGTSETCTECATARYPAPAGARDRDEAILRVGGGNQLTKAEVDKREENVLILVPRNGGEDQDNRPVAIPRVFAGLNGGEKFAQLVEKAAFDAESEQKGDRGACELKTPFLGQTLAKFGELLVEGSFNVEKEVVETESAEESLTFWRNGQAVNDLFFLLFEYYECEKLQGRVLGALPEILEKLNDENISVCSPYMFDLARRLRHRELIEACLHDICSGVENCGQDVIANNYLEDWAKYENELKVAIGEMDGDAFMSG